MSRNSLTNPIKSDTNEFLSTNHSSEEILEDEACEITEIIEILSRKWTLLILRELGFHETLRFNELIRNCGDISPRTLSKRLKVLKQYGLIHRTQYNEIPPKVVYALTSKGLELVQTFKDLDDWAKKWKDSPKKL